MNSTVLEQIPCGLSQESYEPEILWVTYRYSWNGRSLWPGEPIGCYRTEAEALQRVHELGDTPDGTCMFSIETLLEFARRLDRPSVQLREKLDGEWVTVKEWPV